MKFWRVQDPLTGDIIDALGGNPWYRLHHTPWDFYQRSKKDTPRRGLAFMVHEDHIQAPVRPTKIVCIGLNYRLHAEEQGKPIPDEPVIFLKAVSALLAPEQTIVLPEISNEVHHEAELAVVIGKRATRVRPDDAWDYVLGFTCGNDVTARDIQRKDKRYTRAKGFDTFAPMGPAVVTPDEWMPSNQAVICRVNGEERQRGLVSDMIFSIPECIAYITAIMTLEPGDVILTGTPSGVGPLHDGDVVEVEIEGLGVLRNPVRRHA